VVTNRLYALLARIYDHLVPVIMPIYRDPSATYCPPPQGRTWNLTNALRIAW